MSKVSSLKKVVNCKIDMRKLINIYIVSIVSHMEMLFVEHMSRQFLLLIFVDGLRVLTDLLVECPNFQTACPSRY